MSKQDCTKWLITEKEIRRNKWIADLMEGAATIPTASIEDVGVTSQLMQSILISSHFIQWCS